MTSNQELFERARRVIPGGVNSPVRAFGPVGGTPPFIVRGEGCHVYDSEGKRYIDYVGSWGPMILGHRPEVVDVALRKALDRGTSFGAPTESEIELAELLCERIPAAEQARLVSSGTEATMTAVRLARGITGRDGLLKFEGCYHGHGDSFLVAAGSGAATHGHPSSPGVPAALAALTFTAPFNDLAAVDGIVAAHGEQLAAIIVEPIAGNMGCVPPQPGFLEGLRELADRCGALLIFDEVMTGFRVHPRCAQSLYGIEPDLTTLGKIIGGGLPVGAIVGQRRWLEHLSPVGPVYQAGTLSGNPLGVAAGLAQLRALASGEEEIYGALEDTTERLVRGLGEIFTSADIPHQLVHVGSMFGLFFSPQPVRDFSDAQAADGKLFGSYFHAMLKQGIYLAPSPFEAGFVSLTHDAEAIEQTLTAAECWATGEQSRCP